MKKNKYSKIIIHNVIKYWVEPKKYGYEIRILDEIEDLISIECHLTKKSYDEEGPGLKKNIRRIS